MTHLFWIDLEMTGLDVEKEVIIEAAGIVTNLEFEELTTYNTVIKQPQSYIDNMDDWNTKQHGESGLVSQIPSGKSPDVVEIELIDILDKYWPDEKVVLAGNSIGQDRKFIDKYMPKLADKLHYRMLDVSSWKLLFVHKFSVNHKKSNCHRALDDIRESISELKAYLKYVNV